MLRSKSKDRRDKIPGGPSYMSSKQMADYLNDLRTNRIQRPTGARPPPASFKTRPFRKVTPPHESVPEDVSSDHDTSSPVSPDKPSVSSIPPRSSSTQSFYRDSSSINVDPNAGRPLARPPRVPLEREYSGSSMSSNGSGSIPYRESTKRWIEKTEANSLRKAIEEHDMEKEKKVFEAAQDEAAELVWKHQNPKAAYRNPDAPYKYGAHLRKTSHGRSQSFSRVDDLQKSEQRAKNQAGAFSTALEGKKIGGSATQVTRVPSGGSSKTASSAESVEEPRGRGTSLDKSTSGDSQKVSAVPDPSFPNPKNRRRSSGSRRKISGSLFTNPDDKIYEEPEDTTPPTTSEKSKQPEEKQEPSGEPKQPEEKPKHANSIPLAVRRNPFARVKFGGGSLSRSSTDPLLGTSRFDKYEIHKNPVTQSRNPEYTFNPLPNTTPQLPGSSNSNKSEDSLKLKDGVEVRGDDIRAATSMRLKDRSSKLPTPTMVSDSPGRPIVSFQQDWKPKEIELKMEKSAPLTSGESSNPAVSSYPPKPPGPTITIAEVVDLRKETSQSRPTSSSSPSPERPFASTRPLPSIGANKPSQTSVPSINVNDTARPVPSINVNQTQRPIPSISADDKPRPIPSISVNDKPRPIPSISVNDSPRPIPSISVSSTPLAGVPSISVNGRSTTPIPSINVNNRSTTPVPSISVNDSPSTRPIPSISINSSPAPIINVSDGSSNTKPPARPLPTPTKANTGAAGRMPWQNKISKAHWTPTTVNFNGALCANCALPISGRIVSAAGARFHPECFTCYNCNEHLECVAFYPEPEGKRAERIARIRARQNGQDIPIPDGMSAEDAKRLEETDGDESMRFYCHLDYHEFFSPRCKSCKTPIEGEVVVACGAEWHVGHFFCAQCGDPFDSTTPFVEKDGYAWCVGCHTNRYSAKCRRCRKPVTDVVVKALGSEWHGECFVCTECDGQFQDGRYFLRGESEDPVCVKCEERRLKA